MTSMIFLAGTLWLILSMMSKELMEEETKSNIKKAPMKNNLLKGTLYNSPRFLVNGNMGFRLYVSDYQEKIFYVIEYNDLARFRDVWVSISETNKEAFILLSIMHKEGTPMHDFKVK